MTPEEKMLVQLELHVQELIKQNNQILSQVQKTNGRVTKLEQWRNYLIGAGFVILTIVGWLAEQT